jgi:hypothetical protein
VNVAATVAASKAAHPERYCGTPDCLWRVQLLACEEEEG